MTECGWGFDLNLLKVIKIWFIAIRITFLLARKKYPGLQVSRHKEYLNSRGQHEKYKRTQRAPAGKLDSICPAVLRALTLIQPVLFLGLYVHVVLKVQPQHISKSINKKLQLLVLVFSQVICLN